MRTIINCVSGSLTINVECHDTHCLVVLPEYIRLFVHSLHEDPGDDLERRTIVYAEALHGQEYILMVRDYGATPHDVLIALCEAGWPGGVAACLAPLLSESYAALTLRFEGETSEPQGDLPTEVPVAFRIPAQFGIHCGDEFSPHQPHIYGLLSLFPHKSSIAYAGSLPILIVNTDTPTAEWAQAVRQSISQYLLSR
jgi:hypothetical protein